MDGDTLLDGEDDQDFDDWTNATELYNAGGQIDVGGGTMRFVNAFNPCAPTTSRTCDAISRSAVKSSSETGARTLRK